MQLQCQPYLPLQPGISTAQKPLVHHGMLLMVPRPGIAHSLIHNTVRLLLLRPSVVPALLEERVCSFFVSYCCSLFHGQAGLNNIKKK